MGEGVQIGAIVKWKLFTAVMFGFLLLALLAGAFRFTGAAYGLPIGGMGEFYVAFDRLEGTGFILDSSLDDRKALEQLPLVRNEIEGATVYGLHIYKDLHVPLIGNVRLNVKFSEPITIHGLVQETQLIEANVDFVNLGITDYDMTQWIAEGLIWSQNAEKITITDAKMKTNYLFQDLVSLNGMAVTIEIIDK